MFDLKYIIENSGDSTFESYSYSKGLLTVSLFISDLEKKITIKVRTNFLSFNNYYLQKSEDLYRTCHIEIKELHKVLKIHNNIYIPSDNFGIFMKEKKLNYNLAYGILASENKYLLSITGYADLVSCVVSGLENIIIDEDIND